MPTLEAQPWSKHDVRRSFDQSAPDYDAISSLQRMAAQKLIEYAANKPGQNPKTLDIGCGTGHLSALCPKTKPASLFGGDLSYEMTRLYQSKHLIPSLQCDTEALPLQSHSIERLLSNLMLQWLPAPAQVFREWQRILKAGGELVFSTFGPQSLSQLRQAWAAVDDHPHVNPFMTAEDLHQSLCQAGFENITWHRELLSESFPSVQALMRHLKQLGAHNIQKERQRGLISPDRLKDVSRQYPQQERGGLRSAGNCFFSRPKPKGECFL